MPLAEGHTLVIPKKETDYLFDIDNEAYQRLWLFAKEVAGTLRQNIPCKRIGVSVIGLEVACNAIEGSDTVSDAFVEGERTGEYIMHTWHSAWVMRCGKLV